MEVFCKEIEAMIEETALVSTIRMTMRATKEEFK